MLKRGPVPAVPISWSKKYAPRSFPLRNSVPERILNMFLFWLYWYLWIIVSNDEIYFCFCFVLKLSVVWRLQIRKLILFTTGGTYGKEIDGPDNDGMRDRLKRSKTNFTGKPVNYTAFSLFGLSDYWTKRLLKNWWCLNVR